MHTLLKYHVLESDFHLMGIEDQSSIHLEDSLNGCLKDGWEGTDIAFIHLLNKSYQTSTIFQKSCWRRQFKEMPLPLVREHCLAGKTEVETHDCDKE